MIEVDLEHLGDHLRHLDEQALPHLGAAMVEHYAAVGIDVNERARLIERRAVERDAEFDRHGGEAFFHHRAEHIEIHDVAPPGGEVDGAIELVDDALDDVVLDHHAVGSDVVAADAVEVSPPHGMDGKAEAARDDLDDRLDRKHALRPAIASEGGIRYRIGLARQAAEADVG